MKAPVFLRLPRAAGADGQGARLHADRGGGRARDYARLGYDGDAREHSGADRADLSEMKPVGVVRGGWRVDTKSAIASMLAEKHTSLKLFLVHKELRTEPTSGSRRKNRVDPRQQRI